MNQITTYRWSLEEDVTAYRDAGYGAIGVWRQKLARFGEERGIDLLQDSGLKTSSLSWAGGFTGSHGQSYIEAVDDAVDAIRTASELDADCVVIVSGTRFGHTLNHARRLVIDALRRLGDLAGEKGLTLALQPMHTLFSREWTFLTTIDETLHILDDCDHSQVKMSFDAYHLWREPGLLERITSIAPLCSTVRLSDWHEPPRSDNDRRLPGDGCIPLKEIVGAFLQSGYGGFFEVEVWSDEVWDSPYDAVIECCRDRFADLARS